jgi:hypothetical protein
MRRPERPPSLWNVWWALAILSALVSVGAVILEALGILRDLGVVLSFAGLAVTVLFGLTASTRASVRQMEYRLGGLVDELATIRVVLERIARHLGA